MQSTPTRSPSIIHGLALVASGAIGAGMFSLPIVSAGMWFGWAVLALCVVWLVNLCATFLLLESNLLFPPGASFNTLVDRSLGHTWRTINNISIAFVMYILLYAYFSASGSIVTQSYSSMFGSIIPLPQNVCSILFGLVIALLVWSGTSMVSRICAIFLAGMVITFLLSTSGLLLHLEISKLIVADHRQVLLAPYIGAALPYFVTSFACSGIVPSLVKYYGHGTEKIKQSLLYGTLISLLIYLLWLAAAFGNLSREQFAPVIEAGGNMGQLTTALQSVANNESLKLVLNLFSNFAITTSFLSIGLGLFDFLADRFSFPDSASGRCKSTVLTFLPPAVLSFLFPHGFILAIGYAGVVVLFSFFVVPAAMAFANRSKGLTMGYQVRGGKSLLIGIVAFSLIIGLFKILASLELLPVYP